jgi:putative DNA primase/helicase
VITPIQTLLSREVAHAHEHLGWSFTPLDGKRPVLSGWQSRERETLEEALQWAVQGNVGLRTGQASGVVVIDVDPGGSVEHLELPRTVTAVTGRGGQHFYFSTSRSVRNSAGKLAEHVDVRGDGGQVVFVGSTHPETRTVYDWMPGHSPRDVELAELPGHVIELLEADRERKQEAVTRQLNEHQARSPDTANRFANFILRAEIFNIENAAEGRRNDTLNAAAYTVGRLVGGNYFTRADVERPLLMAALHAGLDVHEAERTIESGLTAGEQQPRELPIGRPTRQVRTADGEIDVPQLEPNRYALNLPGNASRFAALFGDDVKWCETHGKFYIWEGSRWRADEVRETTLRCRATLMAVQAEAEEWGEETQEAAEKWATYCNKNRRPLADLIEEVKDNSAVHHQVWDQDDWLLNVQNGILDLRSGILRLHARERCLTKICMTEYDEGAECPQWLEFLHEIMGGSDEMVDALQRLCGYFLTGSISVQILPILYGSGANGKSVFIETVMGILGSYAGKASDSLLVTRSNESHPTEVADLYGKRLVLASETEEGRRLRVALVKQMTGDATLKARYMRQDFFEFRRTHKTVLVTNNKPIVNEDTNAVWRRLRLIPFTVTIPPERQDPDLLQKLRSEWPGILAWMVDGCLQWRASGGDLRLPETVVNATAEYRDESDAIGRFIEECCVLGDEATVPKAWLFATYEAWCEQAGERALSGRLFSARMKSRGHSDAMLMLTDKKRARGWRGIDLVEELRQAAGGGS